MNVGEIEYTVSVETQQAITASDRINHSLQGMQGEMEKTDKAADSLNTGLSKLAKGIAAVALGSVVQSLAKQVQAYNTMAERVKMATESVEEFDMVQQRLQATADGTYRKLSEAQEVFIGTSSALKGMGYSTAQALDVVDSLSYAFVTNATSSQRAESALNALTMATTTGKVTAQQWITLMAAVPSVVEDIANATGKTANEVRELGATGKLAAKDLAEGLRQSVDANKEAADAMANDFIDAGVRMNNAIVSVLAGLEQQTGALDALTNGIISVADVIISFSQDTEKMAGFLQLAETAAASLAAVLAGRVLTAMAANGVAIYQATIGAQLKAAADVKAAQAAASLAAAELAQAKAAEAAAVGLSHHATAAQALVAAEAKATTATAALNTALTAQAGVMTIAQRAAAALRTTLAFLGGPAGIILMVAAAFVTMGNSASMSASEIDQLTDGIDRLSQKTLEYRQIQIQEELEKQERAAAKLEAKYKDMQRQIESGISRSESFRRKMAETGAQMETAQAQAVSLAAGLRMVNNELDRRAQGADVGPQPDGAALQPLATKEESEEFKRLEKQLKDQIALAGKTGKARAELAALQRLGANATAEEQARIAELSGELYDLEQKTKKTAGGVKALSKTFDESKRATADNIKTIKQLEEQLYQTTLTADELVQRQAELQLNEYATPEQIARVRELALEIRQAQDAAAELERRKGAFGQDVAGSIRGSVSPLSGGLFDDQAARYAAEEQAEIERYAAQLQRLREAKELELEVVGGYHALEEQMAQDHALRLQQIDDARRQLALSSVETGFGAVADIMKTAFGEQSAAYKAAFAIQKAAAIAQSVVAIQQGIAMAAANPWPTNLAAMASVAAATAGLVGNIASVTMGGGRQYGGGVSAGKYYKVNEGGMPEIFKGSDGNQYLMPNQKGEVVSNADATAGGAGGVTINIIEDASKGGQTSRRQDSSGEIVDVWVASLLGDGDAARAIEGKYGLATVGR